MLRKYKTELNLVQSVTYNPGYDLGLSLEYYLTRPRAGRFSTASHRKAKTFFLILDHQVLLPPVSERRAAVLMRKVCFVSADDARAQRSGGEKFRKIRDTASPRSSAKSAVRRLLSGRIMMRAAARPLEVIIARRTCSRTPDYNESAELQLMT